MPNQRDAPYELRASQKPLIATLAHAAYAGVTVRVGAGNICSWEGAMPIIVEYLFYNLIIIHVSRGGD
jgi:hypothetical protein